MPLQILSSLYHFKANHLQWIDFVVVFIERTFRFIVKHYSGTSNDEHVIADNRKNIFVTPTISAKIDLPHETTFSVKYVKLSDHAILAVVRAATG